MNQETKQRNAVYNAYVKKMTPTHQCWKNMLNAFISGGIICGIGQCLLTWLENNGQPHDLAVAYVSLVLIAASILLTGFNLVTPLVKFCGAGYLVPITGFANSVASCAIEYKKQGQVFGVGSKIFTIAGPVIVFGIVSSAFFGAIYYILMVVGLT